MSRNKIIPYNPKLRKLARLLRKNSTLSEVLLWQQLKGKTLGAQFHRQVPIDNYIVDFYCHELMLAIEIDGSSHDSASAIKKDLIRQQRLESLGVSFIRFSDHEVKQQMDGVLRSLQHYIDSHKQRPV
ncbi:MAG: endonuclease domain-containing protein [Balneolaceae bacterium]|nr:endonuclease domain-containing protein [Balneolaceae bacterium]